MKTSNVFKVIALVVSGIAALIIQIVVARCVNESRGYNGLGGEIFVFPILFVSLYYSMNFVFGRTRNRIRTRHTKSSVKNRMRAA